jgi:flagellar biosynthesis/type III secretory pathway protein FliH
MKTALQELLDEIKECRNIETDLLLPFIKNKIQSKLPKEREQIEEAYDEGYNNAIWECGTPKSTRATEYYNETFKQ